MTLLFLRNYHPITICRNKVNFHNFHRVLRDRLQYSTKSNNNNKSRIQKYIITGSTLFATGSIIYFFVLPNRDTFKSSSLIPAKSTISSDKFTAIPVHQIIPQSKTTSIFRLKLPAPLQGPFPVSSCVHVKDPSLQIMRPYTPISPIVKDDELGYIDLLVKRYENGQVSKYIHGLSVGDHAEVRGPVPTFPYRENMYKELGMHPDQFKIYYTIDNAPASSSNWNQGIGYITSEMIKLNMPSPPPLPSSSSSSNIDDKGNRDDDNSILILVCGPDGLMNHISGRKARDRSQGRLNGILEKLGYNENQVFKF
ncbi:4104_t:CDS:2 [Ambispora gerdemannii]|uniref:4104_t:CDS:1 n=1 Tax=Ambispora gerdemannii TaxID=144530 RepID=A0A9N8VF48_9GLOM|nr:4104_t:CDS:2 [Ambispora gerdemannii]